MINIRAAYGSVFPKSRTRRKCWLRLLETPPLAARALFKTGLGWTHSAAVGAGDATNIS